MQKVFILILSCALFFSLFPSSSIASTNCGGDVPCTCGDTITSDYTMPADLTCTVGTTALIIGANGITLDLNGHILSGSDTVAYGIRTTDHTNVTIRNGTVTHFLTSNLHWEGASTGTGADLTVSYSGNQGLQHLDTANVTYRHIVSSHNNDDGLSLHNGTVVNVTNAIFDSNAQGINYIDTSQVTASNITISNTTTQAIYGLNGTVGTYNHVTIAGQQHAIDVAGTASVTATDLTVTGSTGYCARAATGTTLTLIRFSCNQSLSTSDGIDLSTDASLSWGVIYGMATNKWGVRQHSGTLDAKHLVFYGAGGKGIYPMTGSNLIISHSIFSTLNQGVYYVSPNATVTMSYCDFNGNTSNWGSTIGVNTNGVAVAPGFVNASAGNFQLLPTSALINAGNTATAAGETGAQVDYWHHRAYYQTNHKINIGADLSYSDGFRRGAALLQ